MASKATRVINWNTLAAVVPEQSRAAFTAFKAKSDQLSAKVISLPEEPTDIDWNGYKNILVDKAFVDKLKAQFSSQKIPVPTNTLKDTISSGLAAYKKEVSKLNSEADAKIAELTAKASAYTDLKPLQEMSDEEIFNTFPETAPDLQKFPYWPHRQLPPPS